VIDPGSEVVELVTTNVMVCVVVWVITVGTGHEVSRAGGRVALVYGGSVWV
jgi:hypothetical protein